MKDMTCSPAGIRISVPIFKLGSTPEEGKGESAPVIADIAHIPKTTHKRKLTQASLSSHIGLSGAALTISFVNVIVKAKMPVERVINCWAKAWAEDIANFAISKFGSSMFSLSKKGRVDRYAML